ncbi:bifunctional adenosylcobinamide kinase/adenosylcobinamide-phosphate guanylyltransferase [Escherichia coli]|nr:bifunctional adenosylcobinamide kinase/adenosylcobinamide-phosphate guanylyltransferase [Escherichia coli]
MMILVTGGARSGKSRHAEALIGDSSQVLYIATSQILDDEMAARIEHHRQGRPAHWHTVERWQHLDELIHAYINPHEAVLLECAVERWQHLDELIHAYINPHEAVLLECVTTMVTNLLFDYGGDKDPDEWDYQAMEQAINAEIQSLIAACQRCPAKVVLVTNEVGMGIVPESRLARYFRDIAGRVNQQLAAAANEVWLVVSGIGVKIK